jgi:quercetin 2,3-dioxygenase
MRKIKKISRAIEAHMENLDTYRALPTREVDHIDPFLFLNHHGPQVFPPHNTGLPFGPHPHRGFETLTFIFKGDLTHQDTSGGKSIISAGGIQWMTAGRGLIHAEVSSKEFMEKGGEVELIQLWFNLPARLKMTAPWYKGLQQDSIPVIHLEGGSVRVNLVSGTLENTKGPIESVTNLFMSSIELNQGATFKATVDEKREILLYVVRGGVTVNNKEAKTHDLVQFELNGKEINIEAKQDSLILFGHGEPYHEPIVAHGPFVMNTQTEIMQAIRDYQMGKMGVWTE